MTDLFTGLIPEEKRKEIEKQYEEAYKIATAPRIAGDKTDHENIVALMYDRPQKIWWFSHEFQGEHRIKWKQVFLSIECASRISELAKDTNLIESRRAGRYMLRRLRTENFVGEPVINFNVVDTQYSTNNLNKDENN